MPPLNETQLELLQNFVCNTVFPLMPLEDFKKNFGRCASLLFPIVVSTLELTRKPRQNV